MLHLWLSYCQLKQDNESLRALLLEARAVAEWWTPDESNCPGDCANALDKWYWLRARIDDAMRASE
jgi:hypothetical protein